MKDYSVTKVLAFKDSLPEPDLTDTAKTVLSKRYLLKDINGEVIETYKDLFFRVAYNIAKVETKFNKDSSLDDVLYDTGLFYNMMINKQFLPNSPTLMNAGKDDGQLAACFVLPVEDSIEGIFDAIKHAAMIHKSGGGTGFSFSRLRPKDSIVGSTGGIASGPLSFMRIFNTATEQVKQGGARRGANMAILRVDHPDILDFIHAKEVEGEFTNFNFSVGLTEDFMKAVHEDKEYDLINPQTKKVVGKLKAKEVFDLMVEKAWLSGEPGIIFLDRINAKNQVPGLGEIEATNPCGEQPLLPYEACNLGSINLATVAEVTNNDSAINYSLLKSIVHKAVRFLDNVIELSVYPLPSITENVKKTRKIGLGVMGWADMLFKLKIPYNSQEAVDLAEKIMAFITNEAREASRQLAQERGEFSAIDKSIFHNKDHMRNATVTTIAPTGTLSIIANCSSGVEPLFALSFTKNILDGNAFTVIDPYLQKAIKKTKIRKRDEVVSAIINHGSSIQGIKEIPEHVRKVFVTSFDVSPKWHLTMQAAFQKHTDNAVSKTVNLPNSATREDIAEIFNLAYKQNCKGVTVYRDGSRTSQVLVAEEKKEDNNTKATVAIIKSADRPSKLSGFTEKINTGLGTLYLTVNELDGKPFEVFATIGKSGKSVTAKTEAIGRLVSLALRNGIDVERIVRQIKGIGGEHQRFSTGELMLSVPDAIAKVLEENYLSKDKYITNDSIDLLQQNCPECGEQIVTQEGCLHCKSCGWSKCG